MPVYQMSPDEMFEKTIKAAKVIMSTVPMQDAKNNYDMHDMRWILKDPMFTISMLSAVAGLVGRMGEQGIEEGVRLFVANAFNHSNKGTVIEQAKRRIQILEEGV